MAYRSGGKRGGRGRVRTSNPSFRPNDNEVTLTRQSLRTWGNEKFVTRGGGGGSGSTARNDDNGDATNERHIDQVGGTGAVTYGGITGLINGANTDYTVSESEYMTGSLQVFLNGIMVYQGSAANEWSELSPSAGTFRFGTAPPVGCGIHAIYQIGE